MAKRGVALVCWLLLLVGLGCGLFLVERSSIGGVSIGAAVLAMVVGSWLVSSASSQNRLSLTIAVVAAMPFVFARADIIDLRAVLGVYLLGGVAHVLRDLPGERLVRSVAVSVRRLIGYTSYAVTFAAVSDVLSNSLGEAGWELLVPFGIAVLVWLIVEVGLWSFAAAAHMQVSARYLALAEIRDTNVFVSLVATGALFGLMYEGLGWWALPVALLPYSFAHGAFKRFQETRSTYRQTIRALAQIPEAAGLSLRGHSDRTAEIAVAMAKDLGLSPEEVDDVEFASLMHDIGHITLNDPTVVDQGWSEEDLARWGAEIIAGAPSLDRVSGYVRRQYEPFRNPGEESDPTVPTVARIVKIASAYDAERIGKGASRLEALEHLHRGAAYDYDPEVVASLRRVLERDQSISV